MPTSRYLFDSDVLIDAKNISYKPEFAEDFWEWIVAGHKAGVLFSVDKVKKELLNGHDEDPLHGWCQKAELTDFFETTAGSIQKWGELSKWVTAPERRYVQAAKDKFLHVDSADAWLIAHAAHQGNCVIITRESPQPESTTIVKLPDAATALGVKTAKLHTVLSKHATGNFKFKL